MTFLIFSLSQNGARRNDVFNCFPFSSANPTFINDRLQTAYVFFIISKLLLLWYLLQILLAVYSIIIRHSLRPAPLRLIKIILYY
jgi:hypothetical protein